MNLTICLQFLAVLFISNELGAVGRIRSYIRDPELASVSGYRLSWFSSSPPNKLCDSVLE